MKNTFFILFFIISFVTNAQKFDNSNSIETFEIKSQFINETRTIKVALPYKYKESTKSYPVILVLDNQLIFSTLTAITNQLSATSRMPESIIVTIIEGAKHRSYYAPNLYNNIKDRYIRYGDHQAELLNFIEKELLPQIENKYRTVNFRTLVGFSPSSIFTIHTFLKTPQLFQAHIALASGNIIGNGYKKGETLIDVVENSIKSDSENKGFLYIVSGGKDVEGQPHIKFNIKDFNKRISKHSNNKFRAKAEIIEGEGHTDVLLPGLISAFDLIYPKEKWFCNYLDFIKEEGKTLDNINNYYNNLSEEYGFQIYPNMNRLYSMSCFKNIGNRLMGQKRVLEAIELYQYWTKLYPKSAISHAYLGLSYKVAERYDESLIEYQKAIEIAEKNQSSDLINYQKKIDEIKEIKNQK